ncbi:MAG: hypothetical protein QXF76_02590 [Candidatus Anstonellales archaeon]
MDFVALIIIIGILAIVGELFLSSGIVGSLGIGLIVSSIFITLNFEQSMGFYDRFLNIYTCCYSYFSLQ